MRHEMKLNNDPFNLIKEGIKTIELRLYDEKRQLVKVGDTIEFTNRATLERMEVKVIGLHRYNSFEELFKHFSKEALGYVSGEANPKDMEQYYSKDEQDK